MTIQFGKSILNTRTIIRRIVNTINIAFAKVNTTVWISYELTKLVFNILSTFHQRFYRQAQLALHQHLDMDGLKIACLDGEARKTIQGKNSIVRIMPADSSIRPHGVGRNHSFQGYMSLSEEKAKRDAYGKAKTFCKCTASGV